MRILYDTRSVHPLDCFSYFRAAAAGELAPVAVSGRPPGRFSAVMAVGQVGNVTLETFELTRPESWLADHLEVADLLQECAVGLIRERLGPSAGITPRAARLIHLARIRAVVCHRLDDPTLDPEHIARAAHMSVRYLHKILADEGTTPMKLVKELRLEECRRSLADPAIAGRTIKDITSSMGYRRQDQFAHDFRKMFGVSATNSRRRQDRSS